MFFYPVTATLYCGYCHVMEGKQQITKTMKRYFNLWYHKNNRRCLHFKKQINLKYSTNIDKFSINYFEENILTSYIDNKLFSKLRNIINLPINPVNKQRRIEKLMNVYLLNKEEDKIELNPIFDLSAIFSLYGNRISPILRDFYHLFIVLGLSLHC